ncbi:hypothetical protein ACS0TY_025799 [Phlomoides rotata]
MSQESEVIGGIAHRNHRFHLRRPTKSVGDYLHRLPRIWKRRSRALRTAVDMKHRGSENGRYDVHQEAC